MMLIQMLGRVLCLYGLFACSTLHAQAGVPGGSFSNIIEMMLPMVFVFGIFYVLVIRPQQKKVKEHRERVQGLKRGEEVVVAGGIVAQVDKVDGEEVCVRISPDVMIRCTKSSVTDIRGKGRKQKKV